MLGGAHQPSTGTITLFGEERSIDNPEAARQLGIGVIYQEFNLVPYLSARENIFLGQEIKKGIFIDKGEERRRSVEIFKKLGVEIDPERLCQDLSIAEQQIVEIAKALSQDVKILVMDEPSATLTPQEVKGLFRIINELKGQGISIIYISHRLDEIFEICDRVYVLRDGDFIGSRPIAEITRREMIEMMVGRKVENEFPKVYHPLGSERLKVLNLRKEDQEEGVSFSVKAGEVLGITGLIGAGRTELMRLIFGADERAGGSVWKDGLELNIRSPKDAIKNGIGLLPEDRKGQGLVLMHSAKDNFGLPNLDRFSRYSVILKQQEKSSFLKHVQSIKLKISGNDQLAGNLSGGNQQKLVLIKWLERNCDVIIFDEPTRGIDVGAKYEIYLLMNALAAKGKAIIMISSELPEVIGMSDRILVMRNGQITGTITDPKSTTQESVMELAVH
jgi:ABC-type sugar transport system ATPase subunit